jgi:hypothetical protein
MPGSLNASPRSAASISASARTRCSAQPYGYSTRYRAPSPSRPSPSTRARRAAAEARHDVRRHLERLGPRAASLRRLAVRATVSGDTSTRTGMTSSNASFSRPIFTRHRTRARRPRLRHASKRTSTEPPASSTVVCPLIVEHDGSRLDRHRRLAAAASAGCDDAPKYALSPTARKRGNDGVSISGLLMRISPVPAEARLRSPATAMIRYVVSDSGSLTSVFARGRARRS